MADPNDELLGGDYELLELIANGKTTQVYEARQQSTNTVYAVKMLTEDYLKDAEAKKTLKYEAGIGQKLEHPNLVKTFDLQMKKQYAFFVMERIHAPNLKSQLRNRRKTAETTDSMLVPTMTAIANALAYMHEEGYLHRDIKPDNILTTRGGDTRLIDFSLVGKPDSSLGLMLSRKSSRKIMGTRTYISPEMVRREGVTEKADIYSFGITLYEMACGRPPFVGNDPNALLLMHVKEKPDEPSAFNPNLSAEGDAFILKCIAKQPANRPESMEEIARELQKIDFWKTPVAEFYAARRAKAEEEAVFEAAGKLDSREDANRDPNAPKPKPKESDKPKLKRPAEKPPEPEKPAKKPEPPKQPAAGPPPGQRPPGGMPPGYPQMPPGYPGMPPQGYPGMPPGQMPPGYPGMPQGYPQFPPGQMPPNQMPPNQMPPGQMPPGQMPPGYPGGPPLGQPQGVPQGPPPGQGAPGQGAPGQGGTSAPPAAAPKPSAPPAAAPKPSAPAASEPAKKKSDDDLPLMTELPDIM